MSAQLVYRVNSTTPGHIAAHLNRCNLDFIPPLSSRVEIGSYAEKLANMATRFEAWSEDQVVALVAAYFNNETGIAFISSVSAVREWTGKGVSACLLAQCFAHARVSGMRGVRLEVACENKPAIGLYTKSGFKPVETRGSSLIMSLELMDERYDAE